MAEQNNDGGKKVLSLAGRSTLKVDPKPGADGMVRQSFSHGRSKTVAVEVKKKRAPGAEAPAAAPVAPSTPTGSPSAATAAVAAARSGGARTAGPTLTDSEREARQRALAALANSAQPRESAPRQPSIAELNRPVAPPPAAAAAADPAAARVSDREALRKSEMEELRRIKEQERQAATQAELKRQQEENAKRRAAASGTTSTEPKFADTLAAPTGLRTEGEDDARRGAARRGPTRTLGRPKGNERVDIGAAISGEDGVRRRSIASIRRRAEKARQSYMDQHTPKEKIIREVIIPEVITVGELASRMSERGADVVKALMKMGMLVTITQTIDADTAELIVGEFGHKFKRVADTDVLDGLTGTEDTGAQLHARPPIVTIMGHVDHGKTSLLDAIRKTQVAQGEAGGITQHIGAYQVSVKDGQKITFIDTPGHAAFSEMRARGANLTDIVVLVVAADDGIMPQTIEALTHAKAAKVPIVLAINKCDLPGANPQKIRTDLLQYELVVEQMGGEILDVEVSAKTGKNLDKLLETILLQAEVMDLKANPDREAQGTVVEAKMEKGRGSVATVLVQKGTLRTGDIFVAGTEWGRVRLLVNDRGENVKEAGPAVPVEVLGLTGTPEAGDDLVVVETEARAREVADFRDRQRREKAAVAAARGSLDQMFAQIKAGEIKELPIVIKGDVHGSIEAIAGALEKLTGAGSEVRAKVLHSAVGPITESDVTLAGASKALIIGFNVRANPQAREIAKRDGLDIRYYSIIYEVIDDVKAMLTGLLKPTMREKFIGHAVIRQVFNVTKVGKIAGCMVTDGLVKRGAGVRLLRENVVIHTGTLKTLKRFKDEVKEVKDGFECGMAFEAYEDIREGDIIEAYEMEEVARELQSA
jgi:translation initiation factor IF-2